MQKFADDAADRLKQASALREIDVPLVTSYLVEIAVLSSAKVKRKWNSLSTCDLFALSLCEDAAPDSLPSPSTGTPLPQFHLPLLWHLFSLYRRLPPGSYIFFPFFVFASSNAYMMMNFIPP